MDSDGATASPDAQAFALQTPVPQPLLYEGMAQDGSGPGGSQNGGGPVFDPQNGNFTTQATDASVPVTGPALSMERTYNSLDPRARGAFGTGWSSLLDMQVSDRLPAADGSTATEMVTYPDGEQIEYGKNADGTYTSPQGRYGTLALVTGGFQLIDKGDTTYTFAQDLGSGNYGITSIADPQGHTLNFTYSAGVITQVTSQVSQRSLYLTWSTPSGAQFPHVATVATDPVTPGQQSTRDHLAVQLQRRPAHLGVQRVAVRAAVHRLHLPERVGLPGRGAELRAAVLLAAERDVRDHRGQLRAANEGTDNGTYAGVTLDYAAGSAGRVPSSVGAAGVQRQLLRAGARQPGRRGRDDERLAVVQHHRRQRRPVLPVRRPGHQRHHDEPVPARCCTSARTASSSGASPAPAPRCRRPRRSTTGTGTTSC